MTERELKRAAAQAALAWLTPRTKIGIGTGSTVSVLIDQLDAESNQIYVSSSQATTQQLSQRGIDVEPLNSVGSLEVYVDGADFADSNGVLLKGGGGAQTSEKIVASVHIFPDRLVVMLARARPRLFCQSRGSAWIPWPAPWQNMGRTVQWVLLLSPHLILVYN